MTSVNLSKVAAILAPTLLTAVALIEYAKAGSRNGSTGSIAFNSDRKATVGSFDIYRMDADGSNEAPVTSGLQFNTDPA